MLEKNLQLKATLLPKIGDMLRESLQVEVSFEDFGVKPLPSNILFCQQNTLCSTNKIYQIGLQKSYKRHFIPFLKSKSISYQIKSNKDQVIYFYKIFANTLLLFYLKLIACETDFLTELKASLNLWELIRIIYFT